MFGSRLSPDTLLHIWDEIERELHGETRLIRWRPYLESGQSLQQIYEALGTPEEASTVARMMHEAGTPRIDPTRSLLSYCRIPIEDGPHVPLRFTPFS